MKRTEARVRAQVERALGQPLSDAQWTHFRDDTQWVDMVLAGEAEVPWLVERIRQALVEVFGAAPQPPSKLGRSLRQPHNAGAPFWGLTRQDALCTAMAALAGRDAEVRAFRRETLAENLLTYTDTRREFVDVWLTRQAERERRSQETDTSAWPLLSCISVLGARVEPLAVKPGGALDWLRQLAERLADQYHWEVAAAAAFILTGLEPNVATFRVTIRPDPNVSALTRLVIEVDLARTPEDLAEVYKRERDRLLQSRPRAVSEKHLGLGAYAATRPPRESLAAQMAAWNAMVPDPQWSYENKRPTNFARDRAKAFARLVHPDYRLPAQEETISYDDFRPDHDHDPRDHNDPTNYADDESDEA